MSTTLSPVELIEPTALAEQLQRSDLLILDTCNPATYRQVHLPGAVHIAPSELMESQPPVMGKLPSLEKLNALFSRVGYNPEKTIVVYDDEGGGWAGRLLWTLDLIGHTRVIYLNGGLHAWLGAECPVQTTPVEPTSRDVTVEIVNPFVRASAEDIMEALNSNNERFVVWDARSPEEYAGVKQLAMRAGHIPGAVNFEWTAGMDQGRKLRLREDMKEHLESLGLGPDKSIVTHCQSHHRSGFTYMVGRILGYPDIKAYDGSWSEWGNRQDTPVAQP